MIRRLAFLLALIFLFPAPSFALFGDDNVIVHRTFYVPYMPGAREMHGAYRLIAHTADFNTSVVKGNLSYKTGKISNDRNVTDAFQTIDLVRSDLVILTNKSGIREEYVRRKGKYEYHDTVYYETPEYVFGYFFDFSPLAGSSVMQVQGKPYFVASRVSDLANLFRGADGREILKSLVNYRGARIGENREELIPLGGERYVVSQKPTRMLFNWWQELSQEFLAENMAQVKSFDWQEISGYYDETAYRNGTFKKLPVYGTSFDKIPSNEEMFALWKSNRRILGKSPLGDHFTDYMTPTSVGTWISSSGTFVSCDPNLLLRWLYKIPQKKGNPVIKISTRIPDDFSVLKVHEETYRKVAFSDPNVFFAFAPFNDRVFDAGAGVSVFFPYTGKYKSTQPVSVNLKESNESRAEFLKKLDKYLDGKKGESELYNLAKDEINASGSGSFKGVDHMWLYGIAGCYFVPADRTAAIDMLKKNGFSDAIKAFKISDSKSGRRPSNPLFLREW